MAVADVTIQTTTARPALAAAGRPRHDLATALATVWLLTILGALLGLLAPGLAPGGRPHPTLHGTVGDVLGILATNLRLLCAPFTLALLGFPRSRASRWIAELLIGALVALNTVRVGLAIGRDGSALIPYIPQLPLEWLALALSTSAWLASRHSAKPRTLQARATQTLITAAMAAVVETLLTPHAR